MFRIIINQTYKNLKIICINNKETDNSPQILKNTIKEQIEVKISY